MAVREFNDQDVENVKQENPLSHMLQRVFLYLLLIINPYSSAINPYLDDHQSAHQDS